MTKRKIAMAMTLLAAAVVAPHTELGRAHLEDQPRSLEVRRRQAALACLLGAATLAWAGAAMLGQLSPSLSVGFTLMPFC